MGSPVSNSIIVAVGGREFLLSSVDIPTPWAVGNIRIPEGLTTEDHRIIVDTLPKAIVPVSLSNLNESGCTDGRVRKGLLDGGEPSDTQKTVGCDVMELFAAAESLGKAFYGVKVFSAPSMDRFKFVLEYMAELGNTPTTHEMCGARAGLVSVLENGIKWARDKEIAVPLSQRLSVFANTQITPGDLVTATDNWDTGRLKDYDENIARTLIIEHGGEQYVEVLKTDETPTHGHTEITKLHLDTPGYTFSTRKYQRGLSLIKPELADYEAFAVNDDRINSRLAPAMGINNLERKIALTAMHLFGDAGHDTLSQGLPTYRLSLVQ